MAATMSKPETEPIQSPGEFTNLQYQFVAARQSHAGLHTSALWDKLICIGAARSW